MSSSAAGWPTEVRDLLERLQKSQIAAASRGRKVVRTGSFVVMLNEQSDFPWFNYAVPIATDFSDRALEELSEAFAQNGRRTRLEFIEPLWPELAERLESWRLELQMRAPVMTCTASTYRALDLSPFDAQILAADGDLRGYLDVGNEAFGGGPAADDERIERHRRQIVEGTLRCSLVRVNGEPAASACTMPESGVAELAGVATRPAFRRQGLASAASAILLEELFGRLPGPSSHPEAIAWLSAGDEIAQAVYERLGFQVIGAQLNYIAPE